MQQFVCLHAADLEQFALFQDDEGEEYFMATNFGHEKATSSAASARTITLKFPPHVESIWRLSRKTGAAEELVVRGGILQLQLPDRTGDLFKMKDGEFPGLDEGTHD